MPRSKLDSHEKAPPPPQISAQPHRRTVHRPPRCTAEIGSLALTQACRAKDLHRLEIEHAGHGGRQNGNLPCTHSDFERHGVRRKNITKAVNKLVRLGLVEIMAKGRMAYADLRTPSRYRLTYLFTRDENGAAVPPTHEWHHLEKQKARGDLTHETGGDLTPTEVEKPGAICTPMPGAICTPLSKSRVDGRGLGRAEALSSVLSVPSSSPREEDAVPPPTFPADLTSGSNTVVIPGRSVS